MSNVQFKNTSAEVVLGLNLSALKAKYGATAERLVDLFIQEIPASVAAIELAIFNKNVEQLSDACHYMKGAARAINAQQLQSTIQLISRIGSNGDWDGAETTFRGLSNSLASLSRKP